MIMNTQPDIAHYNHQSPVPGEGFVQVSLFASFSLLLRFLP